MNTKNRQSFVMATAMGLLAFGSVPGGSAEDAQLEAIRSSVETDYPMVRVEPGS